LHPIGHGGDSGLPILISLVNLVVNVLYIFWFTKRLIY
jgi:hypothetical protein